MGFFEAGNFHPDFIVWIRTAEGVQHIVFVDPKGIRNVPAQDPRVRLHETIKEIEDRLEDKTISLHSFIISNTQAYVVERSWSLSRKEIEACGIFFSEDDNYIEKLVKHCLTPE